jgi:D-alanyl-D-alanine endopeptidase (penicillin-binding protein 7)
VAAPIASITKLMTALVVLDAKQPLNQPLEITQAETDLPRGGTSRLSVGTVLTRGDLMHLALMSSENRAAHALGVNYPGGLPALVAAMNVKAAALGMSHSHFVDPTGLSSDNVASAEDLSKLVIAASHNARIREYSTDQRYTVRVRNHLVEFHNTDNLVANPAWNIIVQKTGYITEAGKCLVMEAVIEGRSVVIVLLDSVGKLTRVADAKRVKSWMEATAAERVQVSMR